MSFVQLGDLVSIQTGKLDANASSSDGAYPFFTCAREPLKIANWKYDLDAILIAGNGDLNIKHYKGKFDAYQRTYILSAKNDKVDTRYLFHFLDKYLDRLREQSIGGIIKYIKLGMLTEAPIPLPPLDEQKRIAAILDQAEELRRKRQRAIERLNQLGQAIFHNMFGDPKSNPRGLPWAQLGEIADFYSGNSLPEGEPFAGQDNGHLLLKVSDLNHDLNQKDIVCAASWSATPGSRAGTCPPNSLIFPKRGGAIGTNKKRWLKRSAILDPNLMGVHPNETDLKMSFLSGWFQTFNLTDIASGSSVPQLNKQDLAPLELALPPVSEQMEYALIMETLADIGQQFMLAFDHDSRLFSVLQHRAFRGEL